MRVVFMGTPQFAVPSLSALLEAGHDVAAVVTQPDRPAGRGRQVRPSAVKQLALERDIPIEQPEKLRDPAVVERLRAFGPEAIVVAAYGKILPRVVLDVPPRGAINVHGSLLPKYRGAAPIQRALLAGETATGITIMQMNERMDAGDILLQREVPIRPDDTAGSLQERMAKIGAAALVDALGRLLRGDVRPVPQQEEQATLAPMIRKEEGEIDWRRSAIEIERAIRAFQPWPGAYTRHRGKILKILRAVCSPTGGGAEPGTVLGVSPGAIEIATGDGILRVIELQPEGRRRMSAREAFAGQLVREGEPLGRTAV